MNLHEINANLKMMVKILYLLVFATIKNAIYSHFCVVHNGLGKFYPD